MLLKSSLVPSLVVLLTLMLDSSTLSRGGEPISPAEELFAQRVLPLFKARCLTYHGNAPRNSQGNAE